MPRGKAKPPEVGGDLGGVGMINPDGVLSLAALRIQLDALTKRMEKAGGPVGKARELQARISVGEGKIVKATGKLPADDPRLVDAQIQIGQLRGELAALYRDFIIPFHVLHLAWYLANDCKDNAWPLAKAGMLRFDVPGVLQVAVELPATVPF